MIAISSTKQGRSQTKKVEHIESTWSKLLAIPDAFTDASEGELLVYCAAGIRKPVETVPIRLERRA